MSTAYLSSWLLNTRKKTAVRSVKFFEAKTIKPNGPITPFVEAFFSLQRILGSTFSGCINSASWRFGRWNETSTSAYIWRKFYTDPLTKQQMGKEEEVLAWACFTCEAVMPVISKAVPPLIPLFWRLTSFRRNLSISLIGHCVNCLPFLSSTILLGIDCKINRMSLLSAFQ